MKMLKVINEGSTHKRVVQMPPARAGSLERQRVIIKKFTQIFRRGDKGLKESQEKIAPKILDLQAGEDIPAWVQRHINIAIWGSHDIW